MARHGTGTEARARLAPAARTAGAAALSALAFAGYAQVSWPWFALGWVGLVPWLAALDRLATLRGALAAGWLMSVCFTLAVFSWFIGAIAGYADAPWAVGLAVVVATAPLIQPQFLVHAAARHLARRAGLGAGTVALVAAAAYVGGEWAVPKLFADTIGHGFLASAHLRQAADLAGAHGLTFVLLLANEAVLQLARAAQRDGLRGTAARPARRLAAAVLLLVAALAAYGAVRLRQFAPAEGGGAITAGLVQAGISHYDRLARELGTYDTVQLILDTHVARSEALLARGVDLLVWPETVYPTTFGVPKSADGAAFDAAIAAFVARAGVPLIFGSYDVDRADAARAEYNAAFVLAPGVPPADAPVYRKALLFPFTERVPAWLDRPAVRAALPWLGTWRPGAGTRLLTVPLANGRALRVAPLICYDAVDPAVALAAARDGAELIVTMSNDSWFDAGGGPRLHLVVSAFRSIETRRAQVRATNTGISAVIDPTGALVETLGVGARGGLAARVVPRDRAHTLLLAWGDWFPPAAFWAAVLGLAAGALRRRRSR